MTRGDAHQENLFLPFNRRAYQPIWIDWETAVCGIGLYDLVYMLFHATDFDIEMRRKVESALLRRYHSRLIEEGIVGYSFSDCLYDYRLCVIANLFSHLLYQHLSTLESPISAFKDWDCAELIN